VELQTNLYVDLYSHSHPRLPFWVLPVALASLSPC
jgi:hypothetical protein